jgi:hypothetical protein
MDIGLQSISCSLDTAKRNRGLTSKTVKIIVIPLRCIKATIKLLLWFNIGEILQKVARTFSQ